MMLWALIASAPLMAAAPTGIVAMKWERRVLLVSAADASDAALRDQRRIIAAWKREGDARDLSVVEVVGDRVTGASDGAAALRRRYALSPTRFTAILIGKDGGEKLRQSRPITAATLETTIDAMPMRRAGER